jgi:rhomboid protease GluP
VSVQDPPPFEPGDLEPAVAEFAPEPPPLELWNAVGDVTPWGTLLLLLSWAVVFALMAARHELGEPVSMLARGANAPPHGVLDAAWRALASTFIHESPPHVFFNAITLLVLGQACERIFAPGGFPLLCAMGGSAASLGSLAWRLHRGAGAESMSVGGSGIVFALGGALLAVAFRLRHRLAVGRARALGAVVLWLTLPALTAGFQVHGTDNAAHASGVVAGATLGLLVPVRPPLGGPRRSPVTLVLGVLAALALAATLARVLSA